MELTVEVEKYLASRKVGIKAIQKVLKGMQSNFNYKNIEELAIISMLKETWLGKLESNIQDLEEVLECLSRRLLKTRVSLLNILNQ
ncbi:hypothetical protein FCV25MIE_28517 [Fagus crenata]